MFGYPLLPLRKDLGSRWKSRAHLPAFRTRFYDSMGEPVGADWSPLRILFGFAYKPLANVCARTNTQDAGHTLAHS